MRIGLSQKMRGMGMGSAGSGGQALMALSSMHDVGYELRVTKTRSREADWSQRMGVC